MSKTAVNYSIKGKYDNKATRDAKKDFTSLADSVKSVSNVIKGLVVVKAIQGLGKVAQATKGIYQEQNKALTNFNIAVSKSNIEVGKLLSIQKKISHNNFIDADAINNATALGIQMGLNEEQLEKVLSASSELASAGVMPLDQAVKSLSQSYTGQATALSKYIPDVKELTKTELANGDAVDLVLQKYEGYADAMSKTFSGRSTQWNNAISDLKAAIGSIPTAVEFMAQGKLLEPLNKITDWIVKNRNYIINIFLQLPSVASATFENIKNIFTKTMSNLPEIIMGIAPMLIQTATDGFLVMFQVARESFKGMMSLLDWAIGTPFRKSKDYVNTMLNNLIEGLNALPQHLPQWTNKLFGIDEKSEMIKYRFKVDNSDNNKTWEDTAKKISDSIKAVGTTYKNGGKKIADDWMKILNATSSFYKDDMDNLQRDLKKILGKDLPKDLQDALDGITFAPNGTGTFSLDGGLGSDAKNNPLKDTILSSTGEIGALIKSYMDDGWRGVVSNVLGKIASVMTSASEIINNALNSISYVLNQVLPPVIRFLENVLAPVLPFLRQMGEIMRDVFKLLEPVFSSIGGNMIKVALTVIITILDVIYNVVVAIRNAFVSKKNEWGYRDIKNDVNQIWDTSSNFDTSAALTSSNASSSYSQARDIYVNINYNHSYVNGDADAIALNIRDRIREAEAMGY